MNKLDGKITRNENGYIEVVLNREVKDAKIYFKNKMDDEFKFLMDVNNKKVVTFNDPDPNNRTVYLLKELDGDELFLAERLVPLENFCNFRDLGGYKTLDGRKVKWGLFYRSEELSNLKGNDLEYFKSLGIKYIFDYRSKEEERNKPDAKVEGVINLNISGMGDSENGNLDMASYMVDAIRNKKSINPEKLLIDGYKAMPLNNIAFKKLMEVFKDSNNTAILQHCTAGKDRTGFGSALILLALGVDEETVIKDYLASNEYRNGFNDRLFEQYKDYILDDSAKEMFKGILGVKREFIETSMKVIKDKYGDYKTYFDKEYGLSEEILNKLKEEYLY